jgi:hypothetical protein
MITSILEYRFSDHYFNDSDNRFKYRVKDVELLNNFANPDKAKARFRQVMYDLLLTKLDRLETRVREHMNFGLIFGEVVFIENGKIVPAIIKGDNNTGNLYVAIIKGETVVTLELLSSSIDNLEIIKQLNRHEQRSKDPVEITALKDISGIEIPAGSNKRPKITVNLDIPDADFYAKYKTPTLINNKFSAKGLSEDEVSKLQNQANQIADSKPVMAGHALTADMKQFVPEKEWVINKGSKIYVRYPDGIKPKIVDEIIVDEKGASRKYILRFKNTAALYPLNVDSSFISTPKQQTDTFNRLMSAFDLKATDEVSFEGPIKRFMDYRKKTGAIGVVIDPKSIVY